MANNSNKLKITTKYLEFLPKLKQEKTQKFTTLVLTIFAFAFFGFFAISPTLSTIAELKKQLSDNKFVNEKLDDKIKNLSLLQQKYASLSNDLPLILSALPEKPEISTFVGQIQAIATSNSVSLIRLQTYEIELSKEPANPDYNNYFNFNFSIGVEGSYNNLINFSSELTNFNRIINIDGIAISKNSTIDNKLQMDIKGKTYFKK